MIHITRRSRLGLLAAAVTAAVSFALLSPTHADTPLATSRPAELAKLLDQRVEESKRGSDVAVQLYGRGLGDYSTVMLCDQLHADARLEAAATHEDRLAVLHESKDEAVERENLTKERFHAGLVNDMDVAMSTTYRLKMEIEILRESAK